MIYFFLYLFNVFNLLLLGRSYSNFVLSKNITIRSEDLIPENNIVSCAYGDYFIHSDPTVGGQLSLKIEGITVQGCGKCMFLMILHYLRV